MRADSPPFGARCNSLSDATSPDLAIWKARSVAVTFSCMPYNDAHRSWVPALLGIARAKRAAENQGMISDPRRRTRGRWEHEADRRELSLTSTAASTP